MSHVYETEFLVDDIRDMQGREAGISKIWLESESILPQKAFSGVYPDESKLEEVYWGNVRSTASGIFCASDSCPPRRVQTSSSVSYSNTISPNSSVNETKSAYQRAALVMFPYSKQLSVMSASEGSTWALQELEKSKFEGPTKENREFIGFLAKKDDDEIKATILTYAFQWDDPSVWDIIVESDPRFFLSGERYHNLCNGWQTFGLDGVRPT
jgi:hypothetical protein